MPKLLQLNCTANWGSTGKIAEGIAECARSNGWETAIAWGRYMNPSGSELWRVGSKSDVYAHYARHRLLDGEGLGSRWPTERLIKRIEEWQPDVVHLHNIHDHWLNYPLMFDYLATTDIPVVWTFHDCWAFTGGCPHFVGYDCNKWIDGCSACPEKHRRCNRNFTLKKRLYSALGKRLTIVPVSNWLTDFVRLSFLKDCNIHTIHNGIELSTFTPCAEKRKMVIAVASTWTESKGLSDLKHLRQLLPSDFDICIVGLDDKQLAALPDDITGIKRTQNAHELARLYSEATALVNPTYSDTFPTVNLEALACGTPVVTYRTGGSPEAVNGDTGIVVEQGNVKALAEAVMQIAESTGRFTTEQCRARAVANFDKKERFQEYIDLYNSLIRQ